MCETLSTTIFRFTRLYLKMPVLNLSICKDAKVWSAKKLSHVAESKLCVSIFFWPKYVTREEGLVIMGKILTTSV